MVAVVVSVFFWFANGFTTPVGMRQKNICAGTAVRIYFYESSAASDDELHTYIWPRKKQDKCTMA